MGYVFGPYYMITSQGILKILEVLFSLVTIFLVEDCFDGDFEYSSIVQAIIAGCIIAIIVSSILFLFYITTVGKFIEYCLTYQMYFNFIWFIYMVTVSSAHFVDIVKATKFIEDRQGEVFAKLLAIGALCMLAGICYLLDSIDNYYKNIQEKPQSN